jgi:hypothetical protein
MSRPLIEVLGPPTPELSRRLVLLLQLNKAARARDERPKPQRDQAA